jgi:hypothetical protein
MCRGYYVGWRDVPGLLCEGCTGATMGGMYRGYYVTGATMSLRPFCGDRTRQSPIACLALPYRSLLWFVVLTGLLSSLWSIPT